MAGRLAGKSTIPDGMGSETKMQIHIDTTITIKTQIRTKTTSKADTRTDIDTETNSDAIGGLML